MGNYEQFIRERAGALRPLSNTTWVKTEILMKAERIYGAKERYDRPAEDRNPNISVHIARTDMNTFLPPTYIEDIKVGKPNHWVKKYLEGSFLQAEGMVYPNFEPNIVRDITYDDIVYNIQNRGWQVIGGADFGIIDNTVLLQAAIDPVEGVVYLYDEYVKNRVSVGTHSAEMKRRLQHIPVGGLLKLMGDPSGAKRSISDMKSVFNHYQEHGIYFQKANNRIDAGIMKVYSYLEMGKLKILGHLEQTIKEGAKYMYKPAELGQPVNETPIDVDNHTMDALRYLVAELPDDPVHLASETYNAADFRKASGGQDSLPWELQDDNTFDYSKDAWMNNY